MLRVVKRKDVKDFEIRWPSPDEISNSSSLFQNNRQKGELLRGVFAVVAGGRIRYAEYEDANLQNAFYEGWTSSEEVTNLLVYIFLERLYTLL